MRHWLFLGFTIGYLSLLSGATMPTTPHPLLKSYQWQNRLLLVFTPEEEDELYRQQLKEFNRQEKALKERDLLILRVYPAHVVLPNGVELDEQQAQSLREAFIIPPDETVTLLIGKDGTEKLRSKELMTLQRLFLTIDAMPMRQQEMRQDGLE